MFDVSSNLPAHIADLDLHRGRLGRWQRKCTYSPAETVDGCHLKAVDHGLLECCGDRYRYLLTGPVVMRNTGYGNGPSTCVYRVISMARGAVGLTRCVGVGR